MARQTVVMPVRAGVAAALLHLYSLQRTGSYVAFTFEGIPLAALIGWMVRQRGDDLVVAYVAWGVCLMLIWNNVVFRAGSSLNVERAEGVLPFNMAAQAPLWTLLWGKSLAHLGASLWSAVAALCLVYLIGGSWSLGPNPAGLAATVVVSLLGILATSFVFSPLMVLVAGRPGFYNAIMPLGIVLGGFLAPASQIPAPLAWVTYTLPSAWSTQAAWDVLHGAPVTTVIVACAVSVLLSLAYIRLAIYLFSRVERRVRISGALNI